MLEDDFSWVARKAFKGLGLAPAEAARQAGLPENEVMAFSKGKFSADTARRLAPVLGLNPAALATHDRYEPAPLTLPGIRRLDLPFGGERVNAWLVSEGGTVILFDTGYEPRSCIEALSTVRPEQIFITHSHPDHIGGIASFGKIPIHNSAGTFHCGPLTIRTCDLSGHATPALGYHIEGLALPLLVTGDALFAGSMGGCGTPELYQHALSRLKEVLTPLPDATVILPGHGPATTLGEERRSNPFL